MPCVVCANGTTQPIATLGDCSVLKCLRCTSVFCDPMPTQATLATAYDQFNAGELSREESALYTEHARNLLTRIILGCVSPGRFLDYGCGGAHFVSAAASMGWEAVGVEVDEVSVRAGIARGLDVRKTLEAGDRFDLILLFHVLEHVTEPSALLERLVRQLNPSGTMVIGVPDQDSFPSIVKRQMHRVGLRKHEYGFVQPPIHVTGFNRRSLQCLGDRLGFTSVYVEKVDATDPDCFPVGNRYWASMPVHRAIYSAGAMFGSGGHLRAVFKRASFYPA